MEWKRFSRRWSGLKGIFRFGHGINRVDLNGALVIDAFMYAELGESEKIKSKKSWFGDLRVMNRAQRDLVIQSLGSGMRKWFLPVSMVLLLVFKGNFIEELEIHFSIVEGWSLQSRCRPEQPKLSMMIFHFSLNFLFNFSIKIFSSATDFELLLKQSQLF